jgi:hypothetical protein
MSKKDIKPPYKVGYRKPPAHTRFQPGQSGNPAGRRKGQPSVDDLMLREAARRVKVKNGDGGVETITKHEVVVRQLWKTAMQGDLAAERLVMSYMAAAALSSAESGPQDETGALSLPAKPDDETLRRMLKRFKHLLSDEEAP